MEKLTSTEIDILIDSLDDWQVVECKCNMIGAMIRGNIHDDEGKKMLDEAMAEHDRKHKEEERRRRDIAIILKAKLLGFKQAESIDKAMKEAR